MSTSGLTDFNLELSEIVEDAFGRCGLEPRSGYDFRTARRSLNLLTIEWANRGINLWTVDQGSILLTTGLGTYALPTDTIDLLSQVIRTGSGTTQIDINMSRISADTYATIPAKNVQGRPVQLWVNRQATAPEINIWPLPDASTVYSLVYWRLRRIQNAGDGGNTQDVPFRFIPAMVAGLAYYLSLAVPGVDPTRVSMLKADYEEQFQRAAEEDREKASFHAVPRIYR